MVLRSLVSPSLCLSYGQLYDSILRAGSLTEDGLILGAGSLTEDGLILGVGSLTEDGLILGARIDPEPP